MFCRNCGTQCEDTTVNCPNCGYNFVTKEMPAEETDIQAYTPAAYNETPDTQENNLDSASGDAVLEAAATASQQNAEAVPEAKQNQLKEIQQRRDKKRKQKKIKKIVLIALLVAICTGAVATAVYFSKKHDDEIKSTPKVEETKKVTKTQTLTPSPTPKKTSLPLALPNIDFENGATMIELNPSQSPDATTATKTQRTTAGLNGATGNSNTGTAGKTKSSTSKSNSATSGSTSKSNSTTSGSTRKSSSTSSSSKQPVVPVPASTPDTTVNTPKPKTQTQKKTQKPQTATQKVQTATPKPQTVTPQPQTVTPKPQTVTPKPQTVTPKPQSAPSAPAAPAQPAPSKTLDTNLVTINWSVDDGIGGYVSATTRTGEMIYIQGMMGEIDSYAVVSAEDSGYKAADNSRIFNVKKSVPINKDEFMIPDSEFRLLTEADIAGMTADELKIARNEIYARHGRKFKDNSLNEYFLTKSWYGPNPSYNYNDDFSNLSAIEDKNAHFLRTAEEALRNQ